MVDHKMNENVFILANKLLFLLISYVFIYDYFSKIE